MLFDGGRSALLPAWLGRARAPGETPVAALWAMTSVGLGIVLIWWLCHVLGVVGGSTDPVNLYAECSTPGTMLILFVSVLTAASLPVFIRRHRPRDFSIVRHAVMPLLGALALVVPFIELFQPGQPVPYSVFPYAAIGSLIAAGAYAAYLLARNPRAGSTEGSIAERTRA